MKDRIDQLIDILFDDTARVDEQDDAAMDLGDYDDNRALDGLIRAAKDPNTDDYLVLESCGDAIANIWIKRNFFSKPIFDSLRKLAKISIYQNIANLKPEWIEKYDLRIDSIDQGV